jgi:hypothetical protein
MTYPGDKDIAFVLKNKRDACMRCCAAHAYGPARTACSLCSHAERCSTKHCTALGFTWLRHGEARASLRGYAASPLYKIEIFIAGSEYQLVTGISWYLEFYLNDFANEGGVVRRFYAYVISCVSGHFTVFFSRFKQNFLLGAFEAFYVICMKFI